MPVQSMAAEFLLLLSPWPTLSRQCNTFFTLTAAPYVPNHLEREREREGREEEKERETERQRGGGRKECGGGDSEVVTKISCT